MNARIINLRTERKKRERLRRKAKADANALAHGRTKAEKDQTTAERRLEDTRHEGHRRDDDD